MSYKLVFYPELNKETGVIRLEDNAFIPFDPANTDYQEYLEWTKASPMNVAEEAQ